MASVIDDGDDDSLLEAHRTSLLEVIEEKNRTLNKKSLVHKLVYISKIRDEEADRNEIGNYYERLFKNLQNLYQTETVSGLMLIYLKHIVHVVETSTDILTDIVRDLAKSEENEEGLVSKSKILVISHDVPHRQYQQWSFRTLDIQAPRLEAYEPSESNEKLVVDLLTQLLKLGNHLAMQPKSAANNPEISLMLKGTMDNLHERVPELLPQQAVVHYLLEEDEPGLFLPNEYLDMYDMPFDIVLDSEMTWPLQTKLFPYN